MLKLPCPPELWPQFSDLLTAALELPTEQRAAWLDTLPPRYALLRSGLARVIAHSSKLEGTPFLSAPHYPGSTFSEWREGQSVGTYVLERELGHGGMAEVWLATRADGSLKRQVALKLPHAHLLAGSLRQRFERERDILAALSHPNIAPLYDAGISEAGHPFLAMEWIEGVPITRYCRESKLAIAGRLDLFDQVLDAVNYAHTRLIAHRDLKPSNILVTGTGQVKLLDFGIAKLMGGEPSGMATKFTQIGGPAATPDYAAPEQIAGQPMTTAVDIYAMGVILFELLTGTRPFDTVHGARIAATEVSLASKCVTEEQARCVGALTATQLRRALQGDLDAIVGKALEIDPAHRYGSAAAFAEDLNRYRRHEPVVARRIGTFQQLGKFVRRNRLSTTLASSLVVALLLGSAGVAWEGFKARDEARRAEQEARRAQTEAQHAADEVRRERAVKDFLIGMFKASDPAIALSKRRGAAAARELLDAGSTRIETDFARDADTEIELLGIVAGIYHRLDENDRYSALRQRQMSLIRSHNGELDPVYIDVLLEDAEDALQSANTAEGRKLLERADSLIRRAGMDRSELRAHWWLENAWYLESEPLRQREAMQSALLVYNPQDDGYPFALEFIGHTYFQTHDYRAAENYARRAIAAGEALNHPNDGELLQAYDGLGRALLKEDDLDGGQKALERAMQLSIETYGETDFTAEPFSRYASLLHMQGKRQEALRIFAKLQRSIPKTATSGPFEKAVYRARVEFGECLTAEGRAREALPLLHSVNQHYVGNDLSDRDGYFSRMHMALGDAYERLGRAREAELELRLALDVRTAQYPADSREMLAIAERWGRFLMNHGDAAGAALAFSKVLDQAHGRNLAEAAMAQADMARLAIDRHDKTAGLDLSKVAVAAIDSAIGLFDVRDAPYVWRIRAQALLLSGEADAALDWSRRALGATQRYDDASSLDIASAEATLRAAKAAIAGSKQTDSIRHHSPVSR